MYDYIIRRLFRDRVSKHESYHIIFAERGNRNRTRILEEQVHIAQSRHIDRFGGNSPKFSVESGNPKNFVGLQVVDYLLWALQRLYERREDRFIVNAWQHYKLVVDMDDRRRKQYGEYYDQKRPLTLEELRDRF